MARKLRIEYPGACYHVINRGNFRSWIFVEAGARTSFLACLKEACEGCGWVLHAWCLMGNHYHLALETPAGNLVEGMRWLQSTFSNRFNRYRRENGHVFQGRYKAILLDEEGLGSVCHYIHLNPARAGIVPASGLEGYADSSLWQLWRPRRRWGFQEFGVFLEAAGGLADKPAGRRSYRDYLVWLSADPGEQKDLGFEKMSRGWAKGSKEFRASVLKQHQLAEKGVVEREAGEVREALWERTACAGLVVLGKDEKAILAERKGVEWKVALARLLRAKHLASNSWIAARLKMGRPGTVSQYVNRHKRATNNLGAWKQLVNAKMLD